MNGKETCVNHTFCKGKAGSECFLAGHLRFQAENGTIGRPELGKNLWERDKWVKFRATVEARLGTCELPEQLTQALNTVQPNFVEDQAKEA